MNVLKKAISHLEQKGGNPPSLVHTTAGQLVLKQ